MPDSPQKKVLDSLLKALIGTLELSPLLGFPTKLLAELSSRFGDLPEVDRIALADLTTDDITTALQQLDFSVSYAAAAYAGVIRVEELLKSLLERPAFAKSDGSKFAHVFVAGLQSISARNLDELHVHVQPVALRARNWYESSDHALGIFIANTGDTTINVQRALFFTDFGDFESGLSVYSSAFRSASHNAYEIKFGRQWQEFRVLIEPGARVFTYLPLEKPAEPAVIKRCACGLVVLQYDAPGSGRHVVRV